MIDLACSLSLLGLLIAAGGAFQIRASLAAPPEFARVDAAGSSVLLSRNAMLAAYWILEPVARACVRVGLTANAITALSLALGLGAGVALGFGHFGIAAALAAVSSLGDAVDGLVARASGTSSDAGEVFDAAADRYEEFFFLGGLAFFFRDDLLVLGVVLLTLLGSFMVSYGTAKAEALQIACPRGAMRRAERALYLGLGVVLAPIGAALAQRLDLASLAPQLHTWAAWLSFSPGWAERAPIVAALLAVGIVSNVSAVRRLRAIAAGARARTSEPTPAVSAPPSSGDVVHSTVR